MNNLTPYLIFKGDCEEAINFYKDCFGGKVGLIARYSDGPRELTDENRDKIMHVSLTFPGGLLFAADDMGSGETAARTEGSNVHLNLTFDTLDEMQTCFDKMREGGKVTLELEDQFWGARFGMLSDRFGIQWMFNCQLEDEGK